MSDKQLFTDTNVPAYSSAVYNPVQHFFQLPGVYGMAQNSGLIIPVARFKPTIEPSAYESLPFARVLTDYFGISPFKVGSFDNWPNKAYAGEKNGINLRNGDTVIGYATTLFIPVPLIFGTSKAAEWAADTSRHLVLQRETSYVAKPLNAGFWASVLEKKSVAANSALNEPTPTENLIGHDNIGFARVLTPVVVDAGKTIIVLEKGSIPSSFYRTAAIVAGLALHPDQTYKSSTPLSTGDDSHYALVLQTTSLEE